MSTPLKISVIMPSYNQGQFLEASLCSVLDQNYTNLELIIMDGGSTDGSIEIIKKYERQITFWQSQPDGGQSAAINAGMQRATGDILCWLNSDDLFVENTIETVAKIFEKNDTTNWISGNGVCINREGKILSKVYADNLTYESLLNWFDNPMFQPSVFWRKSIWDQVGGLNEALHFAMDFELWLKFCKISDGLYVDKLLSKATIHDAAKTQIDGAKSFVEVYLVLKDFGEHDLALKKLSRVVDRAFMIDEKFSFITRNRFYRKWRDKNEQ